MSAFEGRADINIPQKLISAILAFSSSQAIATWTVGKLSIASSLQFEEF
jgi:hypothetical protein